jgi:hypothetical protein
VNFSYLLTVNGVRDTGKRGDFIKKFGGSDSGSKEKDGMEWAGSICFRIGTSGGLL